MPEHPPPRTPIRRNALSSFCAVMSSLTRLIATGVSETAMLVRLLAPLLRDLSRRRLPLGPLLLEVADRRLDRVLGQHRAVDLDGGQLQLVDDVRVLDLQRVVDALALEPLGGQARAGDGGAAAEGLELGVLDDAGVQVDLDLQFHHVAALWSAHETRPQARRVLAEGPDVPGITVVIDHLVA